MYDLRTCNGCGEARPWPGGFAPIGRRALCWACAGERKMFPVVMLVLCVFAMLIILACLLLTHGGAAQ